MNIAKKYLPLGAVAFVGAAIAQSITAERSLIWKVAAGVVLTGGALYAGSKLGLAS